MTPLIIPIQVEAAVEGTRPIDGDGVVVLDRLDEVESVGLGKRLDPKIIHTQGEGGGPGAMFP